MAAITKPLPGGKSYHFNVIYNHATSIYTTTSDKDLSLQFVKFLVDKLNEWGYTKCYYYHKHSVPGRDVFTELFRVVKGSIWTFVIVTEEFSNNSWVDYCEEAAFRNLIDGRGRDALIPITIGTLSLPKELCTEVAFSFNANPSTWSEGHKEELKRLKAVLDKGASVAVTAEGRPLQEHGDEIHRSEKGRIILQPVQEDDSDRMPNFNERQKELSSYSAADFHVSRTQAPSSLAASSEAFQDSEMSPSPRTDKEVLYTSKASRREQFCGISCLLTDIGTKVLRRLLNFYTVTPSYFLDQFLKKNEAAIRDLHRKKILNNTQFEIIFPKIGTTDPRKYDILLTCTLLLNVVPNLDPHVAQTIRAVQNDINLCQAHASSARTSSNDFSTHLTRISSNLIYLCKCCSDPDLEDETIEENRRIMKASLQDQQTRINQCEQNIHTLYSEEDSSDGPI